MPADDDRALMERLALLEAEVKSDADAQRARKAAALEKVREQRAQQAAERDALRERQAELVSRKKPARRDDDDADDDGDRGFAAKASDLDSALALAKRASNVKQELTRAPKAGEKSWVKSGIASALLGPVGWLYAGSLREAVPASAAWLLFALIASKLPFFLIMPIFMVALPLSGIAGALYAVQHNRKGSRQRLFDKDKPKKQLPGGK